MKTKQTITALFVAVAALVLARAPIVYSKDIRQVYAEAKSSIVLIVTYDQNKIPLSLGTGFYFRHKSILTNYHVVENGHSFAIKFIGSNRKFIATKVSNYSESLDLAIISVDVEAKPLIIQKNRKTEIGEKVVAIGNPKGLEGSLSTGIVSGLREVDDFHIIQITAPISPGSSGGPVLNENGEVLGVATFTVVDGQNLNFAIQASVALTLEQSQGKWEPKKAPDLRTRTGKAGVELALYRKEIISPTESYSLRNTTHNAIKDIIGIFIYKDMAGKVINFRYLQLNDLIPPGLARMGEDRAPRGIGQEMGYFKNKSVFMDSQDEMYDIEFRVLSYDIVEEKQPDVFDMLKK